jgi:hypothetical protein
MLQQRVKVEKTDQRQGAIEPKGKYFRFDFRMHQPLFPERVLVYPCSVAQWKKFFQKKFPFNRRATPMPPPFKNEEQAKKSLETVKESGDLPGERL